MKVTVIGCTGSMSGPDSPASSYLIEERDKTGRLWSIVMDMGPGTFGNLWRLLSNRGDCFVDGLGVDVVMFSHWHADHCSDLLSYQVFRRWHPKGPMPIMHVYSPGGGLKRVRQLDGYADEDGFPEFIFHDFEVLADNGQVPLPGMPVTVGPIKVTPYTVYHTIPTVALRAQSLITGDVITYTGDTDYCPAVVEAARGADIVLADCGFTDVDTAEGIHMTGRKAGQVAHEAGASLLVPTHIQPWTDPQKQVEAARTNFDGKIIAARRDMVLDTAVTHD